MNPEIIEKIEKHYIHAQQKHPDFVKRFGVEDEFDWSEFNLKMYRTKIETETKYNNLGLESILLCEVWEFFDAIANEKFREAIEEGYDIIAVVLRAIERIKRLEVAKNQFRDTTKMMPEVAVAENATTTPTCQEYRQVGDRMLDLLNRVHDFLGKLCRDGRCDDHCSECIDASDLADDVWDLIQSCKEPSQVGNAAAFRVRNH